LDQTNRKLALYLVDNNSYPPDLATIGINSSNGTSYQYSLNNNVSPQTYCVTGTIGTTSYQVSSTATTPTSGGCAGHGVGGVGAVTNITINPGAEASIGWLSNNPAVYPRSWDTTQKRSGNQSVVSSNVGDSVALLSLYAVGSSDGNGFPIVGGKTYSGAVYFRAEVANQGWLSAQYRLSGVWSTTTYGSTVSGSTVSWTRATQTFAVPAGADMLRLGVGVASLATSPAGTKAWTDDIILQEGTNIANYADGSSPNWVWNGTVNNSSSTGPAL
jgi:hypothetical protein